MCVSQPVHTRISMMSFVPAFPSSFSFFPFFFSPGQRPVLRTALTRRRRSILLPLCLGPRWQPQRLIGLNIPANAKCCAVSLHHMHQAWWLLPVCVCVWYLLPHSETQWGEKKLHCFGPIHLKTQTTQRQKRIRAAGWNKVFFFFFYLTIKKKTKWKQTLINKNQNINHIIFILFFSFNLNKPPVFTGVCRFTTWALHCSCTLRTDFTAVCW